MPEPTAGAGYLPVIGLRERRPWNPRILISRSHPLSRLDLRAKLLSRRGLNGSVWWVYDLPLWRGTSWSLLSTEQFVKERKDNLYKYYIIDFLKSQIFCGSRER